MKIFRSIVLYAGLVLGANSVIAGTAALEGLRTGSMKKLVFSSTAKLASDVSFFDADGATHNLSEYRGKYVLVNFWATWCPPCRAEMPTLDRLQAAMKRENFLVVPIATGRNSLAGIHEFFNSAKVTNLPILLDPKQKLARAMGVLGLPISVVLNPAGEEIARLRGDAEWDSDSAKAIFSALLAQN